MNAPPKFAFLPVAAACLCACNATPPSPPIDTEIKMSFQRTSGLYDAPFPSDDLLRSDGTIDLSAFPNPDNITFVKQALALLNDGTQGFPVSAGIYLQATAALDPKTLPDFAGSIADSASVFLFPVGDAAAKPLARTPIQVVFYADGGPFGSPNLLSILPLQGVPLVESTLYAAVVMRTVHDASGNALGVSPTMAALAQGTAPLGLPPTALAEYQKTLTALTASGIAATDVAALAVFTTGSPTKVINTVLADALSRPLPMPDTPPVIGDIYPNYCVYQTTIAMPDYQSGTPPFSLTGGTWIFGSDGKPVLQRMEESRLVLTVPRSTMPANGFPVVVFIRTGGGGDYPLVDRGVQATTGGPPIALGTGPAQEFAAVGWAGVSVDGPLGGLRNTTNGNEDFTIFNIFNAGSVRDNLRESDMEMALFAHTVEALKFAASDCPGFDSGAASEAGQVHFDSANIVLMGHSMGATIAPVVMAIEPLYRALILSGSGGSWIENVIYKQQPEVVRPLIELLLFYNMYDRTLTENDPGLLLMQWAAESADPQVYDFKIINSPPTGFAPRHVLMEQGIVDHYIMPPIANTTSLSLGLDMAGTPLDEKNPALAGIATLRPLLPFSGRKNIDFPVQGNVTTATGKFTAMVVQHPGDGIEDGHEVVFQTEPPKHEYRCFLQSLLIGVPKVPDGNTATCP